MITYFFAFFPPAAQAVEHTRLLSASTLTGIVGVEFRIWNDVSGVAAIPASTVFYVGEAVIASTTDVPVALGASITPVDPTVKRRESGYPYVIVDVPYRRLSCRIVPASEAEYFGATGTDYESLLAKLDRGKTAVYILRYRNPDGTFSPQLLHRYAMLGIATSLPTINNVEGRITSSGDLVVDETPIPT